jgi:hypothetical protein
MLKLDVVEECLNEWSSSIVVAPKPGPGQNMRFCVDLRDVNNITKTIKYPIPNMEDIINTLGGSARYFSKLDAAKGFW